MSRGLGVCDPDGVNATATPAAGPNQHATMTHPVGDLPVIELTAADAGELLTMQRAAYLSEAAAHNDFRLPPLVQTLAELRADLAGSAAVTFGVRDNSRLIAAVRLCRDGDAVELGRLIVVPDRQGEGLGTRLLAFSETVFADPQEMRLFTGEHSVANIRLYERVGYRETGRTAEAGYDLVHFAKPLR